VKTTKRKPFDIWLCSKCGITYDVVGDGCTSCDAKLTRYTEAPTPAEKRIARFEAKVVRAARDRWNYGYVDGLRKAVEALEKVEERKP